MAIFNSYVKLPEGKDLRKILEIRYIQSHNVIIMI